jgi:cytochrome d ubiquinol oxidase subunit I
LQILAGHEHGANVFEEQPVKLAAMEGHWETWEGQAPLILFALPDQEEQDNDFSLAVPKIGSWIVTGSLDGTIRGLKEWPASEHPPVAIVFWSFRIMVGIGMLMLFIGYVGAFLTWRSEIARHTAFLRLCFLSGPLGFVAVITGWITAEVGRQPYTVYGLLRTADSVSPVTAGAVGMSLIVFIFVYGIVFTAGSYYLFKLAWAGPDQGEGPPAEKPKLSTWMSTDTGAPGDAPTTAART